MRRDFRVAFRIWSNRDRHCERSEAIQGNVGRPRSLDCFVAALLAMTIPSECNLRLDDHAAPTRGERVRGSGSILNVEASHLALSETENVSDRLVFQPVRLPLKRFAFEIADGLPDLRDDRAILSSMKAHRLDMRTDHAPLARPVRAYGLAAMDVAAIHAVSPGDIVCERGQHAVDVPRVEAIVEAFEEFQVIVHCVLPRLGAHVAQEAIVIYICTYASAR